MDSKILVGGTGAEKPADPEIQAICDLVKSEFLKQSGVNATEFKAVKYTSQVVNGTNHFVKGESSNRLYTLVPRRITHSSNNVRLGDTSISKRSGLFYKLHQERTIWKVWLGGEQFCILRIYEPLPYTREPPKLDGYQLEKTEEDPIAYF